MKKFCRCLLLSLLVLPLSAIGTTVAGQELQWARQAGGTVSDIPNGFAVDAAGNSYVIGLFSGTLTTYGLASAGGSDIFVAKYDPDGALLWARRAGAGSLIFDSGLGIAVDAAGEFIYLSGSFGVNSSFASADFPPSALTLISTGGADLFVAQYASDGTPLWVRGAGGTAGTDTASAQDIAVDGASNVYITGSFTGSLSTFGLTSAGATDIFLAKYDSAGSLQWAKRAGGSSDPSFGERGDSIAVDAGGNVYVTGLFRDAASFDGTPLVSAGKTDIFVAKYSSSGTLQWVRQAGGVEDDQGLDITSDATTGDIYATGSFEAPSATFGGITLTGAGGAGEKDIFVVKYDPAGTVLWAQKATGFGDQIASGIESRDADDIIFVTGTFEDTVTFGPGPDGTLSAASPDPDMFVAKYDSAGTLQWAKREGGFDVDGGLGIGVDAAADSYVAGTFRGTVFFGAGEANETELNSSSGSTDIFVAKFTESADLDGDGIADVDDNCAGVANAHQVDFDMDGMGDLCDICPADEFDACAAGDAAEVEGGSGATLSLAGANFNVPAGSLSADTTLFLEDTGMTPADGSLAGVMGSMAVTHTFQIGPPGTMFLPPGATLCLDIDTSPTPSACTGPAGVEATHAIGRDATGDGVYEESLTVSCMPDPPASTTTFVICATVNSLSSFAGFVFDSDSDGDGIVDEEDNCPLDANPTQSDTDGDAIGDACDPDIDGDDVANPTDLCAATPSGSLVNPNNGCSIAQLCPCDGQRAINQAWKNHGKYVTCVAHAAKNFLELGLIDEALKSEIVRAAAQSDCGHKK